MEYAVGRPVTQAELLLFSKSGGEGWALFCNALSRKGVRARFSDRKNRWLVRSRTGARASGSTLFHAVARMARRE